MKALSCVPSPIRILALLVLILTVFSACGTKEDGTGPVFPPSGQELRLEPGGRVFGVDGVAIHAPPGALEEAIWLTVERVERPEARPLPEELEVAGWTYRVRPRQALELGRIPLVFELPRVDETDAEDLAATFYLPAAWRTIDGHELEHEDDIWIALDGRMTEDEDRLSVDVWALPQEGQTFSLAHGRYFTHFSPEDLDRLEDTLGPEPGVRRSPSSNVDFHITCEGRNETYCQDIVLHVRNRLRAVYQDFATLGSGNEKFEEPRLPEKWFTDKLTYKVYLKRMMYEDGDDLCQYFPDTSVTSGLYESFWKKLTVCIFDKDRRGLRLLPGNWSAGDELRVRVGSSVYRHTITAGQTGIAALTSLRDEVNNNSDVTARITDGLLVVTPKDHRRIATLEAEYDGSGFLWWHRFDQSAAMTLRHEYFHALQYGFGNFYSNVSSRERGVVEGTAVAGERSLAEMIRSPNRSLRVVDVGLFRGASSVDQHDYRAQDFFVFLGMRVNKGMSHFAPFLRRGGLVADLDAYLQNDYDASSNLPTAYWSWVKNQSIEKNIDIGHSFFRGSNICDLRWTSTTPYPTLLSTNDEVEILATQSATVTDIVAEVDGTYRVTTSNGVYELPYPLVPNPGISVGSTLNTGDALTTSAYVPTRLLHRRLDEGATVEASASLAPLTARFVELSLGPYDGNRAVRIDVDAASVQVASAFYDAEEAGTTDCQGRSQARDKTVIIPQGREKTIWVLVANTATSGTSRPFEVTAHFVDAQEPTIEILRPTANQAFSEGHAIPVSARLNLPSGQGQIRWYLGSRLVHEATFTSASSLYFDTIPVACPRGLERTLRVELEDSRGFIAEDDVVIDVNSVSTSARLAVEARVAGSTTVTRNSPMVHIPMALLGSEAIPDVDLSALFDPRSCSATSDPDPALYIWRSGTTVLGEGKDLLVTDADFARDEGVREPLEITLRHNGNNAFTRVTLIPCTKINYTPGEPLLPIEGAYPACPSEGVLENLLGDLWGHAYDLYRERDDLDRALHFDTLLDDIFDGRVPEYFPMGASGIAESMVPRSVAGHLYNLSRTLLYREVLIGLPEAIAANDFAATSSLEGDDLLLYLHASELTWAHYNFFATSEHGGLDPWWLFSDDALQEPVSDIVVLSTLNAGLDSFMTGFAFDNPSYELNETTLSRGTAAGAVGALRQATMSVEF